MYYELTKDVNLDDLEIITNAPLFREDDDFSYIAFYLKEESK